MNDGLIRMLGLAQIAVFLLSFSSEQLQKMTLKKLRGENNNGTKPQLSRLRLSIFLALLNCIFIICLGVLFYNAFYQSYPVWSLLALILFVVESVVLAAGKMGVILWEKRVSEKSEKQIQINFSDLETLINFDKVGYDVHMLFFGFGAIIWYSLLYASGLTPDWLALWGLIAVALLQIVVILEFINKKFEKLVVVGIFYAPFELLLGLWLLINGIR